MFLFDCVVGLRGFFLENGLHNRLGTRHIRRSKVARLVSEERSDEMAWQSSPIALRIRL